MPLRISVPQTCQGILQESPWAVWVRSSITWYSYGLYYSKSLLEFVKSHLTFTQMDDFEGMGRFEYESHNFRQLAILTNNSYLIHPHMTSSWTCRRDMAGTLHNAIIHDYGNLFLLVFTQEELVDMLRNSLTHEAKVSRVMYRTVRSIYEEERCNTSSITDIPFSQCCYLCSTAFNGTDCPFCICMHRQPSDFWNHFGKVFTTALILNDFTTYSETTCKPVCEKARNAESTIPFPIYVYSVYAALGITALMKILSCSLCWFKCARILCVVLKFWLVFFAISFIFILQSVFRPFSLSIHVSYLLIVILSVILYSSSMFCILPLSWKMSLLIGVISILLFIAFFCYTLSLVSVHGSLRTGDIQCDIVLVYFGDSLP